MKKILFAFLILLMVVPSWAADKDLAAAPDATGLSKTAIVWVVIGGEIYKTTFDDVLGLIEANHIPDLSTVYLTPAAAALAYQVRLAEGPFVDGDKTKLNGISAGATVTNATTVGAAGAVMDTDFSANGLMRRTGSGTYSSLPVGMLTDTRVCVYSTASGLVCNTDPSTFGIGDMLKEDYDSDDDGVVDEAANGFSDCTPGSGDCGIVQQFNTVTYAGTIAAGECHEWFVDESGTVKHYRQCYGEVSATEIGSGGLGGYSASTSVADPGSDTNLPTEQAVRELFNTVSVGAPVAASAPTYSDSTCTKGQYAFGATRVYFCKATNTWDYQVVSGSDVVWASWSNPTPVTPTLTARAIGTDGVTLTLTGSASLSVGAGGNGGFDVDCSVAGSNITATYASGAPGTSLVYTLGTTVNSGDTCDLDYTQPGNGIEATTGGADLASITSAAITNNSTQSASGCSSDRTQTITADGTSLTGWTQDRGSWSVSADSYLRNGTTYEDDFLRYSGTELAAACQWLWIQPGYQLGDGTFGVTLRATGPTGYKYLIKYDIAASELSWVVYNGSTEDQTVQTITSVSYTLGNRMAAQVSGTGDATEIYVWMAAGSDPDTWGAPQYTMTNNPTHPADTGTYAGISEGHGTAVTYIDNAAAGN